MSCCSRACAYSSLSAVLVVKRSDERSDAAGRGMRLGARGKRVTATRPDLNPTSERNGSEKGRPPGESFFESILPCAVPAAPRFLYTTEASTVRLGRRA